MHDIDKKARKSLQDAPKGVEATPLAPGVPGKPLAWSRRGPVTIVAPVHRPGVSDLEKTEQERFVLWLRERGLVHHSIPNSAPGSAAKGAEFKKQGLVAGVPDLYVFIPGVGNLAIEMKRASEGEGAVRSNQWEWLEHLAGCGFHSCVAFGKEAAVAFVESVWSGSASASGTGTRGLVTRTSS